MSSLDYVLLGYIDPNTDSINVKDNIAHLDKVSYLYPHASSFALNNISIDIHKGEFLGLIGPTEAGKTTFCSLFNGIVPQFYGGRFFGHVTVDGKDTVNTPISVLARFVAMVFDDPDMQITAVSVENEIAFALENLSVPREEMRKRISSALEAVRLKGYEKKHPYELSGGEKQKLAIASALAIQPRILILDEPTSQLDSIGSQEIFATLREINKYMGISMVLASHSAEEMADNVDGVILMNKGQIIKIDTPDALYSDVELLENYGLRVPQVSQTYYLMGKYGINIPKIPIHLAQGISYLSAHITPLLQKEKNNYLNILPNIPQYRNSPLLSVKNLSYIYNDGTRALHDISLKIFENEYVLIIGQNGAGKSTLVKHFLKILEPTTGDITYKNISLRSLSISKLAQYIGYVGQNPDNQIFNTTVWDEVAFALKNLGVEDEVIHQRCTDCLEAMGLTHAISAHPLSLPKGDRARVVIAAVLAMQPEVIILDEPTTGQDYSGAKYILDVSRQLHELGKTVIVITHHLYLMHEYAERVIVMGKGSILLDAPIRTAFHAVDILKSTYLTAPQSVILSQALGHSSTSLHLISPNEVAQYISQHIKEEPPFITTGITQ